MSASTLKRLVTGAFLFALLLLGARTCQSESAAAEIQFRVDRGGAELRELYVVLARDGDPDPVGSFRGHFEGGTGGDAGTWLLTAESGTYHLELQARTTSGTEFFERTVVLEDGARITVPFALGDGSGPPR